MLQSMGHKESDTTELLNNNRLATALPDKPIPTPVLF